MIDVQQLRKSFKVTREQRKKMPPGSPNTIAAVDGVSFTCQPGRVFTLLGPNGAGKTTTLRMIATMLQPDGGSIQVNGSDVAKQPQDVRRQLGFLTGATGLYDRLTPAELLKFFADLYDLPAAAFRQRRDDIFKRLDIAEFADRRIAKLSTGMRQKVSIARTLIHDPKVIVFDEPTAGLDVISAKSIIQLIKEQREAGKTIIFSTHIMGEVSLLSDDLAIIHKGKLKFSGTYSDFAAKMPDASLVDAFIRIIEMEEPAS